MNTKQKTGLVIIAMMAVFIIVAMLFYGPVPQPLSYHAFADQRTVLGIPNFSNVVSNLAFVLVGLFGWYQCAVREDLDFSSPYSRQSCIFFSVAVALVGAGSAYYHLAPDNETLVWDRLPMTIAFMALMALIVGEFISSQLGSRLLIPLMCLGVLSVIYWYWTEKNAAGDLRPYLLVQFIPLLSIPVILLCFATESSLARGFWYLILAYIAAKIFETYDQTILKLTGWLSGHTLKHLAAAAGIALMLWSLHKSNSATDT